MAGKPIETRIREQIDFLIATEMTAANGYNFNMGSAGLFSIKVVADEEKNEDQGDVERFEGLGIPENRRTIKAGLYRNVLPFTIHVGFVDPGFPADAAGQLEYAAKAADDWKKAFGIHPQVNPDESSGAFEAQYVRYSKRYDASPAPNVNGIDFIVHIRYRQKRKDPEIAG